MSENQLIRESVLHTHRTNASVQIRTFSGGTWEVASPGHEVRIGKDCKFDPPLPKAVHEACLAQSDAARAMAEDR